MGRRDETTVPGPPVAAVFPLVSRQSLDTEIYKCKPVSAVHGMRFCLVAISDSVHATQPLYNHMERVAFVLASQPRFKLETYVGNLSYAMYVH